MKNLLPLIFCFVAFLSFGQNIKFDAKYKWHLPLGQNSKDTEELKEPLRIEFSQGILRMYYPKSNKFYFDQLETPIEMVKEIKVDKRVYYVLQHDKGDLKEYFRIAKDFDPQYGDLYGIEVPIMENGVIVGYDTFF